MKEETVKGVLEETRNAYGGGAPSLATSHERLYGTEARRFVDYVREGEAVLDVGCGEGERAGLFEGKSVHYAGVDLSEEMVERARKRFEGRDARFEAGDILALPVPDARYDAVLAVGVLHHVPSAPMREAAVAELARAARPGGYVMISVWNFWRPKYWKVHLHQLFGRRNGWDFGDLKVAWRGAGPARYFHAFRLKELRNLLEGAGLEIVEIYYAREGSVGGWASGENLVAVARRPASRRP